MVSTQFAAEKKCTSLEFLVLKVLGPDYIFSYREVKRRSDHLRWGVEMPAVGVLPLRTS